MLNYSYLKVVLTLCFTLYLSLALSFGEAWFWNWNAAESTPFFILFFSLLAPVLFVYFGKKLIPDNPLDSKMIDFGKLGREKPLDALSEHYTSVATVGVLISVFIYTGTRILLNFESGLIGVFIAAIYILIIFIYSIYAMRFVFYVKNLGIGNNIKFVVLFCVLSFDSHMIQVFIETAPKAIINTVDCKDSKMNANDGTCKKHPDTPNSERNSL